MLHKGLVLLITGIVLAGCATDREIIDIKVANKARSSATTPVKIVSVADKRVFQLDPRTPSIPSLKNAEINDPRITSRAIARKRNTYGMALGDILLPEGRTVEQLTREALASALSEAGYRVLSEGDPGYSDATPLSAEIDQFWAWFTPGFAEIAIEFEARVRLVGDWPLAATEREVRGYARVTGFAGTTSLWRSGIDAGIHNLIEAVARALARPPGPTLRPGGKPVS
jgi:uncharacterized lipoprotein YajG